MPARLSVLFAAPLALALSACGPATPEPVGEPPLAGADIGGAFELTSEDGSTVRWSDFDGQWRIVYFGYTFCPDICPLDNVRNAEVVDLLAEKGYSATPVMITVDPARDTPEVMGQYAANIHEKMLGLSGSEAQIAQAAQAYRAYYKKNDEDPEFYSVDHSAFTYLVLPGSGFAEFFRRDVTPETLAERAACFIDRM